MSNKTYEGRKKTGNGVKRLSFCGIAILIQVLWLINSVSRFDAHIGWIDTLFRILGTVLVLVIYSQNKTSSMKMPWIFLIMAAPTLGVIIYFLIGLSGSTRRMRERYAKVDEDILPMLGEGEAALAELKQEHPTAYPTAAYISRASGYPVYTNTRVCYYADTVEALESQLRDMRQAKQYIFMEYHAIEDDIAWGKIQAVLEDKVAEGVEVRVFYDDMGSIGFVNMDFARKLQGLGIDCRVFNPVGPIVNIFLNNRDHRKITVIDGRIGYTGGYNLANEYFNLTNPYGKWKDSGIRLEGDAVQALLGTFLEMWNAAREDKDPKDDLKLLEKDVRLLEQSVRSLKEEDRPSEGVTRSLQDGDRYAEEKIRFWEDTRSLEQDSCCSNACFVQPYADSPLDDIHVGEDVYINIVNSAQRYCFFMTPYLILTDEMIHALCLAAKRGVDVRIVTPGIPDKKIVYNVTRSFYRILAQNGIHIYEWTPGFCHAKMCVSDDIMSTCGTINLDYRSLYHHFENGCFIVDSGIAKEIRRDLDRCMEEARDVTEHYREGIGTTLRLGQLILRLFAELL